MLSLLLACAEPPADSPAPSLSGQLLDPEGRALSGGRLQACASVCVLAETDEHGEYQFDDLRDGSWSIHATGPSEDDAELVIPWQLPSEARLDLIVPLLGEPVAVPDALEEVEVAPGLILELSSERVPGVPALRAAPLAGPDWPALPGVPGEVAQGWSLSPTGAGSEIPHFAEGEAWCTAPEGRSWQPCPETLPDLGSIVVQLGP